MYSPIDSRLAQLNEDQLAEVRSLESRLGKWVLAVEPQPQIAELSPETLQQVQDLERKLGVVLVAYRGSAG